MGVVAIAETWEYGTIVKELFVPEDMLDETGMVDGSVNTTEGAVVLLFESLLNEEDASIDESVNLNDVPSGVLMLQFLVRLPSCWTPFRLLKSKVSP